MAVSAEIHASIHLPLVGSHYEERSDAIHVKYALIQANEERSDAIPLFLASNRKNFIE